jgi:hypothetical protein
MPRTTVDIDASVLRALKKLQRKNGKSLGELVSELLAGALAAEQTPARAFEWTAEPMRARVDLEDDDAVYTVLERG